ncbi:hypothetical protein MMC31_006949 [Peltigera leucophlebia]|nr:hypothetical protein [Peltigera leucophlebia]
MDDGLSDASTGERPQEPTNTRPKRTRQQPTPFEDEMMGGKGPNKEPKKPKDAPSGGGKDQWLEAIKELTRVINGQSKIIKEQGIKLQELEAGIASKDQIRQKLAAIEGLVQETQVKLGSLSQQSTPGPTKDLVSVQWPQLPPLHRPGQPLYFPTSPTLLNENVRPARNSPETNDRTITIDVSRSRLEKHSVSQIKDTVTDIMQSQLETKECKIQQVRILPGEKIELCMESNSQYEDARNHSRWLELAMPGARMKGGKWFPNKCDNVPKSQVMKEGSHATTLKEGLLEAFKGENERERGPDMTAKKVVWLIKVSERPMGSLVIWLKKEAARDFLLREQVAILYIITTC